MNNETIIQNFYKAFGRKDFQTMQQSYHDDATFYDPVFRELRGKQPGLMWEMLITSARDLRIEAGDFSSDGETVRCRWQAWYTFSKTGRPVHNIVNATFTVRNGLIIRHTDHFDFYRWSRQALGGPGLLLGWTPIIRQKVQGTAAKNLQNFITRRSQQL